MKWITAGRAGRGQYCLIYSIPESNDENHFLMVMKATVRACRAPAVEVRYIMTTAIPVFPHSLLTRDERGIYTLSI